MDCPWSFYTEEIEDRLRQDDKSYLWSAVDSRSRIYSIAKFFLKKWCVSMKFRDSFSLNPVGNTSKYTDFINYIDTSSVNAGLLSEVSFLEDEFPSRAQRLVRPGDILYSSVRPNLRHYYLYNDSYEHAVASTGFVLLRNNSSYNTRFAFYYLSTNEVVKYLSNIAELSQSTFPSFSSKDIGKIDLPDIDRKAQDQIVSILSAYDNLIEVNNKRIKVLEQMAENLYKEWFVRFRFPGHETAEFENGIPKGWEYCKLNKVFNVCYGKDHKNVDEGNIPIFGSGGLMRYGNESLYCGESVLIPRKGSLNNILYYNGPFWTVDTMFYTEMLKENVAKYAYYTLSKFDMESYNSGAALPSMTTDILYHLKMLVPDDKTLKAFDEFIAKVFEQQNCLKKANESLSRQRDLLLPRLMSGKLEV